MSARQTDDTDFLPPTPKLNHCQFSVIPFFCRFTAYILYLNMLQTYIVDVNIIFVVSEKISD